MLRDLTMWIKVAYPANCVSTGHRGISGWQKQMQTHMFSSNRKRTWKRRIAMMLWKLVQWMPLEMMDEKNTSK